MAGSLNKATLIGNVGKDPDIRTMNNGNRVCTFSIATSESWKDKNSGEKKEHTDWHNVVVFNDNLIKVIEQYVTKGSKLYIEGAIKTRKWEKEGIERYSTEIVLQGFDGKLLLLGDKGGGASSGDRYASHQTGGGYGGQQEQAGRQDQRGNPAPAFDEDSEIPF